VDGCLTLLSDQLESDVVPMLVIYAVVGVILALVRISRNMFASFDRMLARLLDHFKGNVFWVC
jgi:hypothetical protein